MLGRWQGHRDAPRGLCARPRPKQLPPRPRNCATAAPKARRRNRKRLAEVGAVYDITPVPRTPADILADSGPTPPAANGPGRQVDHRKRHRRRSYRDLHTSSTRPTAATRTTSITRIALVDGNNHQINRLHSRSRQRAASTSPSSSTSSTCSNTCGKRPGASTTRPIPPPKPGSGTRSTRHPRRRRPRSRRRHPPACHPTPAPQTPTRGRRRLRRLPDRQGSLPRLSPSSAIGLADRYRGHRRRLPLPRQGPPRHNRSSLELAGAEAILKLRALHSNDDFDTYWRYHLDRERKRVHRTRYLDGQIPRAA